MGDADRVTRANLGLLCAVVVGALASGAAVPWLLGPGSSLAGTRDARPNPAGATATPARGLPAQETSRKPVLAPTAVVSGLATAAPAPPPSREPAALVLSAADLPAEFQPTRNAARDNETAASESANPRARLAQLQAWGREQGHEVGFTRSDAGGPVELSCTVSRYTQPGGANEALKDYEAALRQSGTPRDAEAIGERSLAYQADLPGGRERLTVTFVQQAFFVDVSVEGLRGTVGLAELVGWAKTVSKKIAA